MNATQPSSGSWWRYGHVWLVIAGPLAVVLAGFATVWLAVRSPDPVLTGDHYKASAGMSQAQTKGQALAPAMQGRNHAATSAQTR